MICPVETAKQITKKILVCIQGMRRIYSKRISSYQGVSYTHFQDVYSHSI